MRYTISKRVLVGTLKIAYLERKYVGLSEVAEVRKSDFEALRQALDHHPLRQLNRRLRMDEIFQTFDMPGSEIKQYPIFEMPNHSVRRTVFGRHLVPTGVISIDLVLVESVKLTNLHMRRLG